jgi:hypothetical protein
MIISYIYIIFGWWFGTFFFMFPYIGNVIIPTDALIFFRGVGSSHHPFIDLKFSIWLGEIPHLGKL